LSRRRGSMKIGLCPRRKLRQTQPWLPPTPQI
jgi:hypothetical protein